MAEGAESSCRDSKGAVRGRSTNDGVDRLTEGPHPRTRCGWILGCEGLSRAVTRRTQVQMVMMVRWASRRDSALESLQVTPDTFGETIPEGVGNQCVSNGHL